MRQQLLGDAPPSRLINRIGSQTVAPSFPPPFQYGMDTEICFPSVPFCSPGCTSNPLNTLIQLASANVPAVNRTRIYSLGSRKYLLILQVKPSTCNHL